MCRIGRGRQAGILTRSLNRREGKDLEALGLGSLFRAEKSFGMVPSPKAITEESCIRMAPDFSCPMRTVADKDASRPDDRETQMLERTFSLRMLVAVLAAVSILGCSGMQPTPMMPTYPAKIGGSSGVSPQQDAFCRQQAYQAAQKAKEANVAKEVGSTAVGALLGAAVGNALEPSRPRHRGPPPRGRGGPGRPGGPPPRGPGPGRYSDPGYGTAGAVTGAAVGAAASRSMIQDTQRVYDIKYNNCVAAYTRR